MEPDRGKPLSGPQPPHEVASRPNGSHVVTLDSTSGLLENPSRLSEVLTSEYHLTARIPNSSLSRRDLSLLLDVLNYQIVRFGCNFSMMLALIEIQSRLLGGQMSSNEISDNRIRLTVLVSEILVKELGSQEFSLYSGEFIHVNNQVKKILSQYLMSKRTYDSRHKTWRPEKFIKIRAVPVNTLYERTSSNTERYSGYTKGYGESHGNAHKLRTKPSVELDGEANRPDKEERNLILRMTDQLHQLANSLWIKWKNL